MHEKALYGATTSRTFHIFRLLSTLFLTTYQPFNYLPLSPSDTHTPIHPVTTTHTPIHLVTTTHTHLSHSHTQALKPHFLSLLLTYLLIHRCVYYTRVGLAKISATRVVSIGQLVLIHTTPDTIRQR